jgi:hypothetical protein
MNNVKKIDLEELVESEKLDNSVGIDDFSLIAKENTMAKIMITIKKIRIGLYTILLFIYDKELFIKLIISLPTVII